MSPEQAAETLEGLSLEEQVAELALLWWRAKRRRQSHKMLHSMLLQAINKLDEKKKAVSRRKPRPLPPGSELPSNVIPFRRKS